MLSVHQLAALRRIKDSGPNRLARAIKLAGLTQEEFAEATGTTQPHISAICNGKYGKDGLPLESIRRFAQYFGCSIEDLFPARNETEVPA